MEQTKQQLYEKVNDLMTEKEFGREISKRLKHYEGLLNEDAIAYLIVDELGRNIIETSKIRDMKAGDSVSLSAVVQEVGEVREFKRKDKTAGRVANLVISDGTGTCRFTLWDRDVEFIKESAIKKGSRIKIVNGYVKVTDFGCEISTGKWGMFLADEN